MRLSGHKSVEGKPLSLLRVGILAGRVASLSFISECGYLERVLEVAGSGHFLLPVTWREGSGAQSFPSLTVKQAETAPLVQETHPGLNSSGQSLSPLRTNCVSSSLALLT